MVYNSTNINTLPFIWTQLSVLTVYVSCLFTFSSHIDMLFERELCTSYRRATTPRQLDDSLTRCHQIR